MKRFLSIACVVVALAAAGAARAQYSTTNPDHVFTAIDAVLRVHGQRLLLTGVLEGAAGPTEVRVDILGTTGGYESLDACERAGVLMMNRPGQFKLEVWIAKSSFYPMSYCRLSKLNP